MEKNEKMYDLIVIGAGPAGISASIYAKRANLNVLVLYYGESNLGKAEKIENYYGFENGISGKELYQKGLKQAQNLGVEVKEEEVLNVEKQEKCFNVSTDKEQYVGKSVVIATGNKKLRPNIKGITEFEGRGISYCAICDGFFYRNKNVVVIGNGKFALSEASHLKNIANNVIILTNGMELEENMKFTIDKRKIKEILGDNRVRCIEFEDDEKLDVDGIFIALGEAGGTDIARKMGVITNGDNIVVDENMQTNIEGLYSCGNSNGGLLQICKAVYEGAVAGLSAVNYIKNGGKK